MAAGAVRYLRMNSGSAGSGLDAVDNPAMLAHLIMNLDSLKETRHYAPSLRLSNIGSVCLREQVLGFRHGVAVKSSLSVGMQITFDTGNAIHDFFQNSTAYFSRSFLGWWRCLACGHAVFGRRPTKRCEKCDAASGAFRYREHALSIPDDPVTGHPDGVIEAGPGDFRVADFKSINAKDFKALEGPIAEHAIQLNGYMHYLRADPTFPLRVNADRGLLIYINRMHSNEFPVKVFHVDRNKQFVEFILDRVRVFKASLPPDSPPPPKLSVCRDTGLAAPRAVSCPVVQYCGHYG
jgi:hypothetical protein